MDNLAALLWGIFMIIVMIVIITVIIYFIINVIRYPFRIKASQDKFMRINKDCQYKHVWDGTGIAIDLMNRSIILMQQIKGQKITRAYSFNNIREWTYQIGKYTYVAVNKSPSELDNLIDKKFDTGLIIRVKDIDYPEWYIRFKYKITSMTTEQELKRWMEIITQCVNENGPNNLKYCPNCGTELKAQTLFCVNCGTKINSDQ